MNSEQKRHINGIELKVGQVWQSPDGATVGKIIGFDSTGTAVVETIKSSVYKPKDFVKFTNPLWVLQPEKKKIEYRFFKSVQTGDVTVFSGANLKSAEKWTQDWLAISPRMEYEYV